MPRQAVRVLPVQVPGVRQGQGRHVLPAAGGGLRAGLTCLVLRRARQQGHLGDNYLKAPPQ